ncbi:MAG: HTH-type transcriptional regulator MhqR [Pelotomaculum sp. PtaB.Bin013]|uniref:MarR family transcriptional regulator n=1 Tax=Pelotomaculum isophthalicicum JI TaxID=947010 RepID=A0A9X4H1Y1_9FIRM|nr:MarR family transcriptional regulator [Pelotomaculum isophthalicicum]MDF9408445.1 MarR family transcriptional regulator [Pelotomaculum isophthalicicum JI]OPX89806.1 MAG: HTH-type transcriptional regulator MhqR [Pelotomaculum sp. PtaB.Bin013]
MNQSKDFDLHDLLFNFLGLFQEKFMLRLRQQDGSFLGLKKNHFKILGILSYLQSLTLTEIGRKLDLEKGSVTTLIDQLEEQGLVIRGYDPDDRRKFQILLSDAGCEAIATIRAGHTKVLESMLDKVDDRELQRFIECLQFSVEFMKKL